MRIVLFIIFLMSTLFYAQEIQKKDFLNLEERKWLKNNKTLKMCANPVWAPIGFYNEKTKQPEGISIDTMGLIEKKLGDDIKFQYIHASSWKESQKFLKDGKCDFISLFRKNAKRAKYALFTKPYMSFKFAIITRNDKPFVRNFSDIADKTFVRKKGSGMIYKLKKQFPDIKIIETKDFLDSLKKVSKGEAYAAVATLPVLSYNANRFGINNVQIAGYTDMETHLSIGVRKDAPILHSILEKGLAQTTSDEHKKIQDKWMSIQIQELKSNNIYYILLSILLLIMVVYYIYQNKKSKERLEELNNTLEKKVKAQTKDLMLLNDELKSKNQELNVLNDRMQEQVDEQLNELRVKDKQIVEQSKMVAVGEMIGNIAHQWRQPLSAISIAATGAIFKKETGILKDDDFIHDMNSINDNAQYLSQTIDDFRNFIKGDRELVEFRLSDEINSMLNLVDASIKGNNINIHLELDDSIVMYSYPNELKQCFINIYNNAKDVLKEIQSDKHVFINIEKIDDNMINIIFKDNGGGIPQDILPRVFEPYFTTKHQSQGTGLGLSMTYNLITNGLNGYIDVKNEEYLFEENQYKGAKFIIQIPINSKEFWEMG